MNFLRILITFYVNPYTKVLIQNPAYLAFRNVFYPITRYSIAIKMFLTLVIKNKTYRFRAVRKVRGCNINILFRTFYAVNTMSVYLKIVFS